MKPRLIGLTGHRGSGKDAVAKILAESDGYLNIKFASPLKWMVSTLMECAGADREDTLEAIEGSKKEVPSPFLAGMTPRHVMQTLGTEWGRRCLRDDFWVVIAKRQIGRCIEAGQPAVVSDVRFLNEAEMIEGMGGETWRIVRPGCGGDDHASEQEMLRIGADRTIHNDGTLQDLEHKVYAALEEPLLPLL